MRDRTCASPTKADHRPGDAAPDMDEALRRVRQDEISRLLNRAADFLAQADPEQPMDATARMAALINGATPRGGFTPGAAALETAARPHAPEVLPGQTRGEYAVSLRLAAREVRL